VAWVSTAPTAIRVAEYVENLFDARGDVDALHHENVTDSAWTRVKTCAVELLWQRQWGGGAFTDESSFAGYTGGNPGRRMTGRMDTANNVTGNGYVETDGNRNSLFDTEAPRNDAMLFGEHVSPVPDSSNTSTAGMRLVNQPLYNQINSALSGNSSLAGVLRAETYTPPPDYCNGNPYPCYSEAQSVMFAQTQGTAEPAARSIRRCRMLITSCTRVYR